MIDILKIISDRYSEFSKKEQKLSDYLLQNSAEINNINIHELSKESGVSAATITRFCKTIGCASFVELKMSLSRLADKASESAETDIFRQVSNYYTTAIERTANTLSEEQISKFIKCIKDSKRIMIYGIGSSGLTAQETAIRLIRMGFNATSESDSHMMVIKSTVATEDTLVIAISNSGDTQEIVDAVTVAKNNGATVFGITSIHNSSLDKIANETLIVHNTKWISDKDFINSQFSIYFLLDIVSLLLLQDEILSGNMTKTISAVIGENKNIRNGGK